MRDVVEPDLARFWACASTEALYRTVSVARRSLSAPISILASFEVGAWTIRSSDGLVDRTDFQVAYENPCGRVYTTGAPLRLPERTDSHPPRQAYLGVPLRLPSGRLLGVLCVVDDEPRLWTTGETGLLGDLAVSLAEQLELTLRLEARKAAESARFTKMVDINHELRTPLQAIVGFTEFLQTETRRETIAAHARTIQAASESVLCIINQALAGCAAEAAAKGHATVELRSFAETCLTLVGPAADEKRLESLLVVDDDVPSVVALDRQKVFQALLNLLNNAVKFTDRGSFTLEITRSGTGLRFAVVDTGIGIAAEKRDLLFHRFSRIDSEHRAADGTGLGLAITKTLVESMRGQIGVVPNRHGDGTTFWFEIPDVSHASAPPERVDVRSMPTPMPGARILVADDLDLNRKLIADMLSIDGYLVDCVADGQSAVTAAADHVYDLILIDMIMPGMDGLAASRAIRALAAPACDVPILALTANCGREQLDSCLQAGMNATLTKPMTFDGLAKAVSTWIHARTRAA